MSDVALIIEDDRAIAELERDYLESHGFEVVIASDGTAGLAWIEEQRTPVPHIVVLDLMLPGIDGFTIARRIRAISDLPIVMVTARDAEIDTIRGLGLGADDYITKPFSPAELVARVKAHLTRYRAIRRAGQTSAEGFRGGGGSAPAPGSAATPAAHPLRIGEITLDPAARRLTVRGTPVELTAKELAILQLLMERPNWTLTREEIYSAVWGTDSWGDQSTVTVHLHKLREKIELDPANPQYLHTVWGLGYRFTAPS